MDVVLVQPDIPWNTGNIGRTCIATGTRLHLVHPIGFSLDDKTLKRAGLDYWSHVDLKEHASLRELQKTDLMRRPLFLFSRFAKRSFWNAKYRQDAVLIFGSETKGLPTGFKRKYRDRLYRIPTVGPVRSLNLSTSVGIVLFEALRQQL